MSLRTAPRDKLSVQNYRETTGSVGQTKHDEPDGDPIPVRGNLYPLEATEVESFGLQNVETRQFHQHAGKWPGNQFSRVFFEGSKWEQVGPAVRYTKGRQTAHTRVVLRRIGTA